MWISLGSPCSLTPLVWFFGWIMCSENVTNSNDQTESNETIAMMTSTIPSLNMSVSSVIITDDSTTGKNVSTATSASTTVSPPVIEWFTIEEWNYSSQTLMWKHDLLNADRPYLVLQISNDTVNITCIASGNPKPEVIILRDNVTLELTKSVTSLSRYATSSYSGVYTCQAKNTLGCTQVEKRIQFSEDGTDRHDKDSSLKQETGSPFIWILLACLTFIIIAIVGVFGYRKRGKQFISSLSMKSRDMAKVENRQALYANVTDIGTGRSAPGVQAEHGQEDSGRFISEEGLVYATVAPTVHTGNKKPRKAQWKMTKLKPEDQVEYVSLDYNKSGEAVIVEEVVEKREDHMKHTEVDRTTETVDLHSFSSMSRAELCSQSSPPENTSISSKVTSI